jgi:hypothetical protein
LAKRPHGLPSRNRSAGYQAALKVLGKAVDRDLRIVEGVE